MYLMAAMEAALTAGEAIMEIYRKPVIKKEIKSDLTPVTEADHAAHRLISDGLQSLGHPILSEEGIRIKYEERKTWKTFWLVDPLDGTKEFIRKNGDFTVNIALIHEKKAIIGVMYVPVLDLMYFADNENGAFRMERFSEEWGNTSSMEDLLGAAQSLPLEPESRPYRVVSSRSHINWPTRRYIKKLRKMHAELELVSRGSALKFCLVAEGMADIYPRFGPTWEWDTGAGQAIAEAAGCRVILHDREVALDYNKKRLLNPWFIVRRD